MASASFITCRQEKAKMVNHKNPPFCLHLLGKALLCMIARWSVLGVCFRRACCCFSQLHILVWRGTCNAHTSESTICLLATRARQMCIGAKSKQERSAPSTGPSAFTDSPFSGRGPQTL